MKLYERVKQDALKTMFLVPSISYKKIFNISFKREVVNTVPSRESTAWRSESRKGRGPSPGNPHAFAGALGGNSHLPPSWEEAAEQLFPGGSMQGKDHLLVSKSCPCYSATS